MLIIEYEVRKKMGISYRFVTNMGEFIYFNQKKFNWVISSAGWLFENCIFINNDFFNSI
ncbi:MAG: Uncharacterised protein [Flavobacteriaceae bacterium]|nr:MAG: Uncharacterised protein [Flavobacteriaceae bacterium]